MSERSQVFINATKNPDYCPYCMRCPRNVRMVKVEPMFWICRCGAMHDERDEAEEARATIARLTSGLAEARAERDDLRLRFGDYLPLPAIDTRPCDPPALIAVAAQLARDGRGGAAAAVRDAGTTIAAQSAELADLRKMAEDIRGVLISAQYTRLGMAAITQTDLSDVMDMLEAAARREQSATAKGDE